MTRRFYTIDEYKTLERKLGILESTIDDLKFQIEELTPSRDIVEIFRVELRLSRGESAVLEMLYKTRMIHSVDQLEEAVRRFHRKEEHEHIIIHRHISWIRKKTGITCIRSHYGSGYSITKEGVQMIDEALRRAHEVELGGLLPRVNGPPRRI